MIRFLIDTHCFLWAMNSPEKLTRRARNLIEEPGNIVLFSAASSWEIMIKCQTGKLRLPLRAEEFIETNLREENFSELPIRIFHTTALSKLPNFHKDPFDRILLAQALAEEVPFLTSDKGLKPYPVKFIWT